VDIRGNPGGIGAMVMAFGGHFLDTTAALGVITTRGRTLRFVANPRRANTRNEPVRPYAGPLAIVVDSLSMSTSEIFAAGMQATGRARIVGENTPGLALPAVLTRLPTGDVLMHVFADFTDPTGRRIEGRGVVPDVVVPLTRRDLLGGRDAPLDAAVTWITGAGAAAAAGQATTGSGAATRGGAAP
jgi:carboxyl-terminal processing protease